MTNGTDIDRNMDSATKAAIEALTKAITYAQELLRLGDNSRRDICAQAERIPTPVDSEVFSRILLYIGQLREHDRETRKKAEALLKAIQSEIKPFQAHIAQIGKEYDAAENIARERILDYMKSVYDHVLERTAQQLGEDDLPSYITQHGENGYVTYSVSNEISVDADVLPREYLIPDIQAIRKAIDAGTAIPGVTVTKKGSIRITIRE